MGSEIVRRDYSPQNYQEAKELATVIAKSDLAPKEYRDKPANVLVAMIAGSELGLSPMQSIQGICVINGRPAVWGDALLALVQGHPDCEDIIEEKIEHGWRCTVKRRGRTPVSREFTMNDAKQAGLLGKQGPWATYPSRMCQMRARGFALRDSFADALRGVITVEEAQDIPTHRVTVKRDAQPVARVVTTDKRLEEHTTAEPETIAEPDIPAEVEDNG